MRGGWLNPSHASLNPLFLPRLIPGSGLVSGIIAYVSSMSPLRLGTRASCKQTHTRHTFKSSLNAKTHNACHVCSRWARIVLSCVNYTSAFCQLRESGFFRLSERGSICPSWIVICDGLAVEWCAGGSGELRFCSLRKRFGNCLPLISAPQAPQRTRFALFRSEFRMKTLCMLYACFAPGFCIFAQFWLYAMYSEY